jgi:hypothetical protein
MAVITDILNCGTGTAGTWYDGCKVTPKDVTKPFLLSPSADIDLLTDTLDNAKIATLIKLGQLIPLNDCLQVTEAGAKTNVQTLPNKSELFVSNGLYKFMADFEANVCFVKSLHKLNKKRWQLLLLDSEGKLFFDNKGGKLNGFEVQSFVVDNESINDGGSKVAMVQASFQLTKDGSKGYNERRSFVLSDVIDWYNVNGVQDVTVKAVSLVNTNFTVQVNGGCDNSTPILGLLKANFKVIDANSGDALTITTVTDLGSGLYKIAGASITAGARTVQLYDSVLNSPVADILQTQFYQSNVDAVVLT